MKSLFEINSYKQQKCLYTKALIISIVPFGLIMLLFCNTVNAQSAFVNNGASVFSTSGATINVTGGGVLNQNNGTFDNSGTINLDGNWTNNAGNTAFINSSPGIVVLQGGTQSISGGSVTQFYDLVLQGTGIKMLDSIDAIVEDSLILNDRELSTDTNIMFVINTATGVITRSNGFVSSLGNGSLSRNTNSTGVYIFPVGSSMGTMRYRQVEITPSTATAHTYNVRMANVNPTTEGYDISNKEPGVGAINPNWYHTINRTAGSDSADVTIYYDSSTDSSNMLVHWEAQWEDMGTIITTPTTVTKIGWDDFSPNPFALSGSPPVVDAGQNDTICVGDSIQLSAVIITGVGPYSYSWSPTISLDDPTLSNPMAMPNDTITYYVTVYDSGTGSTSLADSIMVVVNSLPSVTINATGPFCDNAASEVLNASPVGGIWSGTGIIDTANGLFNPDTSGAGSFTIYYSFTNSSGCSNSDSIVILVNPAYSSSISDTICNGDSILLPGGSYASSTGTYSDTLTTINGCDSVIVTSLLVTPALQHSVTTSDVSCNGDTDGTATLAISGGTAPYTIDWGSADTNALPAGTYTYTITDDNSCTFTDSVAINEPTTLTATATTTDVSCNGVTDGTASLTISGGTTPYSVDWGGLDTNALPGGTHVYTVTDANNCSFTDSISIVEPAALQHSITTTDILCNGETTGTAILDTMGGTPPYTVDWQGENPAALSAGTFNVIITDNNGCDTTITFVISEPTALNLDTSLTHITCYGFTDGSITLNVTGGTAPYAYNWSTGDTTAALSDLGAGTYWVTVTDSNGCSDSIETTLADPTLFSVSISGDGAVCQGDSTVLTADNGDSFTWFTGETSQSITFFPSGDTLAWVSAVQGPCSAQDTMALSLYPLPTVDAGTDTTITLGTSITLAGNTSGDYNWFPADYLSCTDCPNPVASPENDITYYLQTTDSNGCVALDSIVITVKEVSDPFVANIFSPNGDGLNDVLHVLGNTGNDFVFRIYDRWGNILYESTDQNQGWDGSSNGKILNSGEYVYTYSFKDNTDNTIKGHGSVTLVR